MRQWPPTRSLDGSQGLARARELQPDVIVMDLAMPVMDGWAALRELKSEATLRRIPVIALTGSGGAEMMDDVLRAGVDAFCLKPFRPDQLLAVIRDVLEHRERT